MAESFSIRAVLSAADRGFSSAMKNAQSSISNLKSVVTGGLGFGVLAGIGQSAFSAVAGNVKSLGSEVIGTSDSMQKLQQAMRFSGTSESEIQRIAGATGTLKTYADQTVFSLNDVMSTFGALSANGIQDADRMVESVGNAVAVFGGGAEEFSRVGLAFSQAMAAGALHAEDWNQILDASPQLAGGLKKELVKLNPVLGNDFKGAMEEGAITAELLGQAMNNIGMTDMAKDAASSVTTFEGAMGNLEATVTTGMGQIYDSFAKAGVVSSINKLSDAVSKAFPKISGFIVSLQPYWEKLESAGSRVGQAFSSAFSAVLASFSKTTGKIGGDQSVAKFGSIVEQVSEKLIQFAGFLEKNADAIAKVIPHIPKLAAGFAGLKILSVVSPMLGGFVKSIGRLAAAGIGTIASRLFGISRSQEQVGRSSSGSSKKILASAKAFLLMGAGVAMISGGFYLLAQSATGLADSGGAAIGIFSGMALAVTGLSLGMVYLLSNIKSTPKKITALGNSFLKISGGIAIIVGSLAGLALAIKPLAELGSTAVPALTAFGLVVGGLAAVFGEFGQSLQTNMKGIIAFSGSVSVLALAMTPLANTGKEGAIAMGTFGIVVGGLVVIFALFGSSLNAAIPAMLSFGATILMVGTGMSLASSFINVLIPFVRQLGDTFTQVVGAISSAVSSILSSVGSLVSTISDAVSQIVNAIGNTLCNVMQTAGDVISRVVDSISEGFNKICEGVASVIDAISGGLANVLDSIAGIIESVGNSARNAGQGFKLVAEGIATIADLSILDIAKSLGAVATGIGTVSSQGKQLPEVASGVQMLISSLSGAASLAPGIQSMSASLAIMGASLPFVTANAATASASILVMATNGNVLSMTLMNLISYVTLFSAYLSNMSAGLVVFGAAITVSSAGALVLAAALKTVNSSMKSISSNAKSAQSSLSSMMSSVNIVESGLNALKSVAGSAMDGFINAFKSGNKQVTSEAKSMANGIKNNLETGLNSLSQVARTAMSRFTSGLNQGGAAAVSAARSISANAVAALGSSAGVAYSHGYNIGAGFANGMAASLGRVQNIASQMAAVAAQAIAAKAKIGSPSKVTYKQGLWVGEGFVNGIKSMINQAWSVSEDLVSIPNLAIAGLGGFQGELSEAYSYSRNITIIVPFDIDGREFARAEAQYMDDELGRLQTRSKRLAGRS